MPNSGAVKASDRFLSSKHNVLNHFVCVDDLVTDEVVLSEADRGGIGHHILNLRAALARALWLREIYVGRSVLDDLVLDCAKQGDGVPARALDVLRAAGVERPGFVLYPLTSFGMEIPLLSRVAPDLRSSMVFRAAGFAVSVQCNTVESAYRRLVGMARALGIRQRIEWGDVLHFSRAAGWFGRNPLLLVRLSSVTGAMYENQFVYTLKIRSAASALLMLHALSVERVGLVDGYRSSTNVNNFETLDIGHYLVGEGSAAGKIRTRRVPMNVSPLDLARLSDVAAVVSTALLSTQGMRRLQARIVGALRRVERGYFQHVNLTSRSGASTRLYKRLVTSLDWFRQSFGSHANESEAIVALAVAFETLLTDHYQSGVADRIGRRVAICLKGSPGVSAFRQSVVELYRARGSIVHSGELGQQANIARAQAAFACCFCEIASRLPASVPPNDPIRTLLGD